jgi:hypothetical protein
MNEFLKQFQLSGIVAPKLSESVSSYGDDNCTADCGAPCDGCSW